jgi:hypothetical protein
MQRSDTIEGKGTVVSRSGERVAVRYDIRVYPSKIDVTSVDGRGTIPGLSTIQGTIDPVCFFGENNLTLELADGRKATFFFTDSEGSVRINWLG